MGTPGPELANPSEEAQMPPQERYESCNNKYNALIFKIKLGNEKDKTKSYEPTNMVNILKKQ